MQNSANVSAAKPKAAGAIWTAPTGTTLPSNPTDGLDGAFKSLGYVSEDGLENSIDEDSDSVKAWGGDTVLTLVSSRTETFKQTFIEISKEVLKQIYGDDNVTGDIESGGLTVLHNSKTRPVRAYIYEMLLSGGRVKRIVLPNAQITEIGNVAYKGTDPIGYEATITAYPDSVGNSAYEYIAKIS